jgi:hypothetical protein
MRITRRKLVAFAAAAPLAAQEAPRPLPANAEEELEAARAQLRSSAGQLSKTKLPMSTEPATSFRA